MLKYTENKNLRSLKLISLNKSLDSKVTDYLLILFALIFAFPVDQ